MSSVVMWTASILRGRICKRSFISSVRPTVHSNPSRKRSSNLRNLKTLAFCFRVDGKHFQNGAFLTRRRYDNQKISLKHKSKMTGDWCILKILQRSVHGKQLMRFQSQISVFKFLRHSVDEGLRKIAGLVESSQKTASSSPKKEAVPYFTRSFLRSS